LAFVVVDIVSGVAAGREACAGPAASACWRAPPLGREMRQGMATVASAVLAGPGAVSAGAAVLASPGECGGVDGWHRRIGEDGAGAARRG
jgi:hypothetical protein